MKWRVVRSVCTALFVSALWTPSFSQNYYFVIGTFESANADISTFAKNFIGETPDSIYTVSNNGTRAHFYVLKASQDKVHGSSSKQEAERSISGELTGPSGLSSPERTMQGSITEPPVYTASAGNSGSDNNPSSGNSPMKPAGKFFKFTMDTYDGRTLKEQVHQIDAIEGNHVQSFQTETPISLLRPQMKEPIRFVAGVFGYKPVEKVINFYNPALTEGVYRDTDGSWVIPYTLERVERGDVSVMYNVSFFNDAVPMTPESKKDLDELVLMMNYNPNMEITVHAYCNGKNKRNVRVMNDQQDYFDINATEERTATAKQLTTLRAEAVKSYLNEQGIDPARIRTFSWGGHDMLVDENNPNAKINDRIEIEIMND